MAAPIRVVLADDHAILRSGLRLLLGSQPGIEVVGEAGTFAETRRVVEATAPDVVVLDLSMPDGSGLSAISELRACAPTTRILVLTMHDDEAYVRTALAAGAAGYLVKSAADESLLAAVRAVHQGGFFVEVREAGPDAATTPTPVPEERTPLASLSRRERQVMAAVAAGHTNREVAEALGLGVETVESYRARLMQKLGLATRAELTRLAVELGVLSGTSGSSEDG